MPGIKGTITRATRGQSKSVYLSNVLGIWKQGNRIHITSTRGQRFHTSLTPNDGLVYDAFMMLYQFGLRTAAKPEA